MEINARLRSKALQQPIQSFLPNGRVRIIPNSISSSAQPVAATELLKFTPATSNFELWDQRPIGDLKVIDYREYMPMEVQLNASVLREWLKHQPLVPGLVLGRMLHIHPQDNGKTLIMDRYDVGVNGRPTCLISTDIVVELIEDSATLSMSPLFYIRFAGTKRKSIKIQVVNRMPTLSVEAFPVIASRIHPSGMAPALMHRDTVRGLGDAFGYLAVDNSRSVLFMNEDDALLTDTVGKLSGIWIANCDSIDCFRAFSLCCRWVQEVHKDRKTDLGKFLLVLFPSNSHPIFYSCNLKALEDFRMFRSSVFEVLPNAVQDMNLVLQLKEKTTGTCSGSNSVSNSKSPSTATLMSPQKTRVAEKLSELTLNNNIKEQATAEDTQKKLDNEKYSTIPAHEYLKLLKEQIELVTKHLGIPPSWTEINTSSTSSPNATKSTKTTNSATNTTFRIVQTPKLAATCAVQTTLLNVGSHLPSHQEGQEQIHPQFVPLLNNGQDNVYDEDERKFMEENLPDLNGEGFTSISLKLPNDLSEGRKFETQKQQQHLPQRTCTPSVNEQVAELLKNVDEALGNMENIDRNNKTFDALKPPTTIEDRRLSLPSTTMTAGTPAGPITRITRKLDDIKNAEKSFILVEETPKMEQRKVTTSTSRPPVFHEVAGTPDNFHNRKRAGDLSMVKEVQQQQMISDVSSILGSTVDGYCTNTSISHIHMAGTAGEQATTYNTHESFSFASLEYLKRHNLL